MLLQALISYLLTSVLSVIAQKGFVEEIVAERKYLCESNNKAIYSVSSQIQCVSKCSMEENCNLMNYKGVIGQSSQKQNCEVSMSL